MDSKLRAVAESRFAALARKEHVAISTIEAESLATRQKTERLRALRLARDSQALVDQTERLESQTQRLEAKRRDRA